MALTTPARRSKAARALRFAGVVLLLAVAPLAVALAQLGPNGAPGIVNSTAFGHVTPGLSVAVSPFDDTDLNLAVKTRFEEELERTSRTISEQAVLRLSFDTQVIQGRFSGDGPTLGRFEGDSERGVHFEFNIWSSTKDSMLGGRQKRDSRKANVFHMNAELRDERTGKVLWQADAFCEMLTPDRLRIARSMVRTLVANLGRTAKSAPFDIE
jgi:hypothetical protein